MVIRSSIIILKPTQGKSRRNQNYLLWCYLLSAMKEHFICKIFCGEKEVTIEMLQVVNYIFYILKVSI